MDMDRYRLIVEAASMVAIGDALIRPGEAREVEVTRAQAERLAARDHLVLTPSQHDELERLRAGIDELEARIDELYGAGLPDDIEVASPAAPREQLAQMTREQLRDVCRERGLKVSGPKTVLISRILKDEG